MLSNEYRVATQDGGGLWSGHTSTFTIQLPVWRLEKNISCIKIEICMDSCFVFLKKENQ